MGRVRQQRKSNLIGSDRSLQAHHAAGLKQIRKLEPYWCAWKGASITEELSQHFTVGAESPAIKRHGVRSTDLLSDAKDLAAAAMVVMRRIIRGSEPIRASDGKHLEWKTDLELPGVARAFRHTSTNTSKRPGLSRIARSCSILANSGKPISHPISISPSGQKSIAGSFTASFQRLPSGAGFKYQIQIKVSFPTSPTTELVKNLSLWLVAFLLNPETTGAVEPFIVDQYRMAMILSMKRATFSLPETMAALGSAILALDKASSSVNVRGGVLWFRSGHLPLSRVAKTKAGRSSISPKESFKQTTTNCVRYLLSVFARRRSGDLETSLNQLIEFLHPLFSGAADPNEVRELLGILVCISNATLARGNEQKELLGIIVPRGAITRNTRITVAIPSWLRNERRITLPLALLQLDPRKDRQILQLSLHLVTEMKPGKRRRFRTRDLLNLLGLETGAAHGRRGLRQLEHALETLLHLGVILSWWPSEEFPVKGSLVDRPSGMRSPLETSIYIRLNRLPPPLTIKPIKISGRDLEGYLTASGDSVAVCAKKLQVSTRTVSRYLAGQEIPSHQIPYIIKNYGQYRKKPAG
ncbi:MAG: hypothetical protein JNM27_15530 [Leptospirales bacterium]|nr:hypothetical protein [Leptospirales bacterium]